ncbi:hypothetical protein AAFP30_07285 [Gordonia sp. CPCC 205515]|uniref:hypothetical protein n=1 Tax=Gordonia sp. CPCC 205515 TaxID=3140791 RepID=UPI003AF3F422
MPTLLSSDEIDIRLLFTESVPDVLQFLRQVVRDREPIALATSAEDSAFFLNLANLKQFTLADHDSAADDPTVDGKVTVLTSIAEVGK